MQTTLKRSFEMLFHVNVKPPDRAHQCNCSIINFVQQVELEWIWSQNYTLKLVLFLIYIIIILLHQQDRFTRFSCAIVSFVLQGLPGPRGQDGRPVRLSLFFGNNRIKFFFFSWFKLWYFLLSFFLQGIRGPDGPPGFAGPRGPEGFPVRM